MFTKGNNYGSIGKRGKGKLNKELKNYLESLTYEALEQIDISKLTNSEKLKFINYSMPYLLSRLSAIDVTNENERFFSPVVINMEDWK